MKLSLSVRIAEEFGSKEKASMNLEALADLAVEAGFNSLCMRASQVGIQSSADEIVRAAGILKSRGLSVSMVTGNFDIVYNNDFGPACLQNIQPFLRLAAALRAAFIRVALKKEEDIPWARRAAAQAAEQGVKLMHQCHTQSLFETTSGIEQTLLAIDHPNFGLIYEPANLELCGQDYGIETIEKLGPWIFNVYFQNQILKRNGSMSLNTWCRGPVRFDLIPIHKSEGIDFEKIFSGLARIKYRGAITVHQAGQPGGSVSDSAKATANYLRTLAVSFGLSELS